MRAASSLRTLVALTGLGLTLVLSACAAPPLNGDKAGAAEPPITLVVGSPDSEGTPGTAALKHFAEQVSSRSGGRITIRLLWNASGDATDFEAEVIRRVRDGELDLGWVGTRAWDEQEITGFSALQAPFLIADYGVLDAVMASDLPGRMLGELDTIGLTGLGVYPDQLRHPLGFLAPFLTLDDFRGAEIRVPSSRVSDDILRSLGAVPAHLAGAPLGDALASGELIGAESSIGNATQFPAGSSMTMNLTFYPKLFTLFAASERYASLSESSRSTLEAAADETVSFVMGLDPESADIEAFCAVGGTLANADAGEVERIEAAADPVRQALEGDPSVAAYIGQIEDLRATSTPPPLIVCPT